VRGVGRVREASVEVRGCEAEGVFLALWHDDGYVFDLEEDGRRGGECRGGALGCRG
jgi:hypothetical protein